MLHDRSPAYTAVHHAGGNYFDDMRLDIEASHRTLDNLPSQTAARGGFGPLGTFRFLISGALQKFKVQEPIVTSGLRRAWFDEFHDYWTVILGGRPLTVLDFFMLAHDYRKQQQHTRTLEWSDAAQHVQNWQHPSEIYSTFAFARNDAMRPVIAPRFWRLLKKGQSVLEYGCALAPFYSCYRSFFAHLNCQWTLADIANFPFHYARYRYRNDPGVSFHRIEPGAFRDPLGSAKKYDVIVLTTVLEHLDDPVFVADYLYTRLNERGYLVFDYIKSEGKGLDTPAALKMREECLRTLLERFEIVQGKVNIDRDVPVVVGRRR